MRRRPVLRFREVDGEGAAFAEFGGDGHFPTMQQRQALHDCQPEPRPAHISRPRAVNTIEPLKQPLEMLRRYPVTIVVHPDLVTRSGLMRNRHRPMLATELDPVVD